MKKYFQSSKAMTLAEILIVISLIAVISVSIYAALAQGIKVWERGRSSVAQEDVAIFLEKISFDLRNALFYSRIPYEGSQSQFAFPSIVRIRPDRLGQNAQEGLVNQIGKVEYYFDPMQQCVYRRVANYAQAIKGEYQEPQILVRSVQAFRFTYYYLTSTREVQTDRLYDHIPSGVEVEIEFIDDQGVNRLNKYIDILIGD